MTRVLAGALAAGAILALAPPTSTADPGVAPTPSVEAALSAPIGQLLAQPGQDQPSRMRMDITQLTPRMVTSAASDMHVTGKITNIGDRRIEDISIQLQRGEAIKTEGRLRDALTKPPPAESAKSGFTGVARALDPGQAADFTLTVPLRAGQGSLRVDQPGIYPLLVNVNGTPAYGNPSRLVAMSTLLPVLSVPGGAVSPPPAEPPRVTVLWPLVDDRPRLLQPVPQGRPLLADDGLADSLAPGGRLFSLLDAVDKPTRGVESELRRSLCLAVDPSLLETVRAMTQDYLVRTPDGRTVAGEGVEAARRWLDRLRALAVGQCVFALPYADADLVALSRAGATDLQRIAAGGAGLVQAVLAPAQALPGVVWPIEAAIDQRTVSDLASDSPTTILVDETRLRRPAGGGGPFALGSPAERETGRGSRIMPVDALVSTSLSGRQPEATTPASVQNGLATLVFRVALQDTPDRSVVVAPPRRWTAPAGELTVFLDTLAALFDQDLTNPLPLAGALNAPLDGTVDGLDYTAEDAGSEVSGPVMSAVTQANAVQRDLLGAMQTDATTQVQPQSLIDPLQYGLLRATSGAWRGTADGSTRAVTDVQAALTAIRGQVTVVRPAVPYTLASADSELPVQITNGLPVAIRVHISVRDSAGLRPSAIPQQDIPAHSGITRSIPAEVIRSGRFTVDIGLTTPSGSTSLGEPSRFELSSTSYGTITLAITGTAAAALVLLFGRRIYRRIRKPRASALEQGSGQG